jgi:chromosome segregation ATPase
MNYITGIATNVVTKFLPTGESRQTVLLLSGAAGVSGLFFQIVPSATAVYSLLLLTSMIGMITQENTRRVSQVLKKEVGKEAEEAQTIAHLRDLLNEKSALLETMRQERGEVIQLNAELSDKLGVAEANIEAIDRSKEDLTAHIQTLQQEINELKAEITGLGELRTTEAELMQEFETKEEILISQIDRLKAGILSLEAANKELKSSDAQQKARIVFLERQIVDLGGSF